MNPRKTDEQVKSEARAQFYHIVKERLDARIHKGETYTTTSDLARGYETLHSQGFSPTVTPGQSVMQVLGYAQYRNRLFYARHSITQRVERAGSDRYAPHKIYLRPDATPPTDHVLVPMEATGDEIAQYIAAAKGIEDPTVHHTTERPPLHTTEPCDAPCVHTSLDFEGLAERLTEVVKAQADVIETMLTALSAFTHSDGHSQSPAAG